MLCNFSDVPTKQSQTRLRWQFGLHQARHRTQHHFVWMHGDTDNAADLISIRHRTPRWGPRQLTVCFLVTRRSISSTSSSVTRLPLPARPPPGPLLNSSSREAAAVAGPCRLPVKACTTAALCCHTQTLQGWIVQQQEACWLFEQVMEGGAVMGLCRLPACEGSGKASDMRLCRLACRRLHLKAKAWVLGKHTMLSECRQHKE